MSKLLSELRKIEASLERVAENKIVQDVMGEIQDDLTKIEKEIDLWIKHTEEAERIPDNGPIDHQTYHLGLRLDLRKLRGIKDALERLKKLSKKY